MDDLELFFLKQMSNRNKKHYISIADNHPTERPFKQKQKYILVFSLIRSGYLSGEIGTGANGIPDYSSIVITDKGRQQLDMLEL